MGIPSAITLPDSLLWKCSLRMCLTIIREQFQYVCSFPTLTVSTDGAGTGLQDYTCVPTWGEEEDKFSPCQAG